jgi:hypothetical protein
MDKHKDPKVAKTLNRIKASISASEWFDKNGWVVSTHEFPMKNPEAMTLHVSKAHWFNKDKMGIHVETFLAYDEKKRNKSYVTLHLLHLPIIPGTKLKRIAFSKPFVDMIYDEVSSWPGYKFRAGKYGLQPFTFNVNGDRDDFEKVVITEITRICRHLGPKVEKVLEIVLCI